MHITRSVLFAAILLSPANPSEFQPDGAKGKRSMLEWGFQCNVLHVGAELLCTLSAKMVPIRMLNVQFGLIERFVTIQ